MLSEKHEGVMSIRERVNAFLTAQYPSRFCDDCICERLELSQRRRTSEVTSALGTTDCFHRARGLCSMCGEEKKVIQRVPKGPKGEKRPADVIGAAITVAKIATGEIEEDIDDDGKDKAAQALGRKGGKARAAKMTPERRREIARKAAAPKPGRRGSYKKRNSN